MSFFEFFRVFFVPVLVILAALAAFEMVDDKLYWRGKK